MIAAAFEHGKPRRAADAQKQPGAVHQVVRGHGKVERRHAVRAHAARNEERIRQYIARHTEHTQHTRQRIPEKFCQQLIFHKSYLSAPKRLNAAYAAFLIELRIGVLK